MPITIECTNCGARLKAPDTAVGKAVKCPKCSTPIKVTAGGADAPPPAKTAPAPKKAAPPPDDDFDFDEPAPKKGAAAGKKAPPPDDDYDDEPPPAKKGAISKKAPPPDDDYDDEPPPAKKGAISKKAPPPDDDFDDEPPKKGAKKGRDDYDDEDDDRPRGKSKGKKKVSSGGQSQPEPTEEEMTGAFNMYLYTLLGSIFCGPVGLIIFLVMWMGKGKENPLLNWHGKQLVNQFITNIVVNFLLVGLGVGTALVLAQIDPTLAFAGLLFYLLLIVYALAQFVIVIMAMFKAKAGVYYKFPTAFIQLLK